MPRTVKNPPAMQETQVRSLDQKDPLEKGMATLSGILAWRIPWTEEPDWLHSPWQGEGRIGVGGADCKDSDMTELLKYFT